MLGDLDGDVGIGAMAAPFAPDDKPDMRGERLARVIENGALICRAVPGRAAQCTLLDRIALTATKRPANAAAASHESDPAAVTVDRSRAGGINQFCSI